ncbi:MAG: inorganic phosphate transporter, partial [Alloalcanivorax venustensis]
MEWMLEHSMLMLIIAGAVGFLMAWGVGANDVANAMGTSVGAGALTVGQAVMIAIVFEF